MLWVEHVDDVLAEQHLGGLLLRVVRPGRLDQVLDHIRRPALAGVDRDDGDARLLGGHQLAAGVLALEVLGRDDPEEHRGLRDELLHGGCGHLNARELAL